MESSSDSPIPEFERQFLEGMRAQYENDGFEFTIAPGRDALPPFLEGYQPDAIARKAGENIAIEVKQRQSQATSSSLHRLRNLFSGHPDWQFRVVYAGSSWADTLRLQSAPVETLKSRVKEIESLSNSGERRAALVMAWGLLEASLRAVEEGQPARARTPGTVVQTLAMKGYIDEELEHRLRDMIELRNRTVHGDVSIEVTSADVGLVLQAVQAVLASETLGVSQ